MCDFKYNLTSLINHMQRSKFIIECTERHNGLLLLSLKAIDHLSSYLTQHLMSLAKTRKLPERKNITNEITICITAYITLTTS